jgi:sporulation protein YlmC with PRC-barrel domain
MQTAYSNTGLISSEDVEGTNVYDAKGEKIGDIDHLIIDKKTGSVTYAVMSFGGFLSLGENHYPIPWRTLKYDADLDGYRTNITEEQLNDAPTADEDSWGDREYETRLHSYYNVPPYWA